MVQAHKIKLSQKECFHRILTQVGKCSQCTEKDKTMGNMIKILKSIIYLYKYVT